MKEQNQYLMMTSQYRELQLFILLWVLLACLWGYTIHLYQGFIDFDCGSMGSLVKVIWHVFPLESNQESSLEILKVSHYNLEHITFNISFIWIFRAALINSTRINSRTKHYIAVNIMLSSDWGKGHSVIVEWLLIEVSMLVSFSSLWQIPEGSNLKEEKLIWLMFS
jgi:hypothetical protein